MEVRRMQVETHRGFKLLTRLGRDVECELLLALAGHMQETPVRKQCDIAPMDRDEAAGQAGVKKPMSHRRSG